MKNKKQNQENHYISVIEVSGIGARLPSTFIAVAVDGSTYRFGSRQRLDAWVETEALTIISERERSRLAAGFAGWSFGDIDRLLQEPTTQERQRMEVGRQIAHLQVRFTRQAAPDVWRWWRTRSTTDAAGSVTLLNACHTASNEIGDGHDFLGALKSILSNTDLPETEAELAEQLITRLTRENDESDPQDEN